MEHQTMPNPNTVNSSTVPPPFSSALSAQDIRYLLDHIPQERLFEILQTSALNYPQVLTEIRDAADRDVTLRRLFIRCLSPETTSATLHSVFSPFGIIHEAVVIYDRFTGRSKCFGFITFKHVDAAILAMRNPSRRIGGRMTVTQVASPGVFDNFGRKIFVENVPFEISPEELLNYFLRYGEIEEGPIGFDSDSGRRTKGFAFFVYKTEEAAQAAVCVPVKMINGHRVNCKIAIEHRRPNQAQAPSWAAAASSGFYGHAISGQMLQQQPYLSQFGAFRGISPMSPPLLGNSFGGGSSSSRGGQTPQQQLYLPQFGGFRGISPMSPRPLGNSFGVGSSSRGGQTPQQQLYLPQFGGFRGISPMSPRPLGNSFGVGSSSRGGQTPQQQLYLPQFGGFRGISPMSLPQLGNAVGGRSSGRGRGESCPHPPSSAAATGYQGSTLHHQQQFMVPPGSIPPEMYYGRYPYY